MNPEEELDDEILIEIRHRFVHILKSSYWRAFDEGQLSQAAVVYLDESAAIILNKENEPMNDFVYLKENYFEEGLEGCY